MKKEKKHPTQDNRGYLRYLLVAFLIMLLILTSPIWVWLAYPSTSLHLLVLDKSVPDRSYREHASLIWVLNHLKIMPPKDQYFWKPETNYLGFEPPHPEKKFKGRGTPLTTAALQNKELLFITDSYGVYHQELDDPLYEKSGPDYSPIVFGGLDDTEVSAIEDFSQQGGHVIGEFNTFASPTKGMARERLETFFGARWTGWAGRFFQKLEDANQIPRWAHRNWRKQYGTVWEHKGPGWLLVHEDGRLLVLKQDVDIGHWGMRMHQLQKEHPLLQETYDRVPFYFWFDILEPLDSQTVLAEYQLDLTPEGKKKLQQFGVPEHFPAVILAQTQPLRLYLVGDASDNPIEHGPFYMAGRQWLESMGRLKERHLDQRAYFWEFYLPFLDNVLSKLASPAK